jgi:hypothetical protein
MLPTYQRSDDPLSLTAVSTRPHWIRLLLGLLAVYAVFQWSAAVLGSDRGQGGLLVAVLVVSATLAVEWTWFGVSLRSAMRELGLAGPRRRGLFVSAVVCGLILLVPSIYAKATGATVTFESDSLWLLPGLFAQGGIAEETLFRLGGVGRAAALCCPVVSFGSPFRVGRSTIWPSALLHFVVQATVKILVVSGDAATAFPFVWMMACAVLPLLVFGFSTKRT